MSASPANQGSRNRKAALLSRLRGAAPLAVPSRCSSPSALNVASPIASPSVGCPPAAAWPLGGVGKRIPQCARRAYLGQGVTVLWILTRCECTHDDAARFGAAGQHFGADRFLPGRPRAAVAWAGRLPPPGPRGSSFGATCIRVRYLK